MPHNATVAPTPLREVPLYVLRPQKEPEWRRCHCQVFNHFGTTVGVAKCGQVCHSDFIGSPWWGTYTTLRYSSTCSDESHAASIRSSSVNIACQSASYITPRISTLRSWAYRQQRRLVGFLLVDELAGWVGVRPECHVVSCDIMIFERNAPRRSLL